MAIYKRNTNQERKGKVVYNESIVQGIVALAVSEVKSVSLTKGRKKDKFELIKVEFNGNEVVVEVTVDILYGHSVTEEAFNIQQNVIRNIESMSKYKVKNVNVNFSGVFFEEN